MVKHYFDKTENVQYLNITNGQSWSFHVGYSVPISAKKGDIISVTFESEITNPQSYLIQTGRFIILGDTPTETTQSKSILPAAGENLTPQLHHQIVAGSCAHTFADDFDGFINVVLYSISSAAGAGAQAILEPSYGRLDVLHFPADQEVPTNPGNGDGSVTLTAVQAAQIKAALLDGHAERESAAALLP